LRWRSVVAACRSLRVEGHGHPYRPVEAQDWPTAPCPRSGSAVAEPPPADRGSHHLTYHLQTSGVGWLIAALVLVVVAMVVFAGGLKGPALTATVIDDAVVGWADAAASPGAGGLLAVLAAPSSWWVLNLLFIALILVLLVLRGSGTSSSGSSLPI
jgi:hypothetical protein